MKKIDNTKIEQIKEKHFEYCKKLRPQNKHKIKDEDCYFLCCEDPFDFNNSNSSQEDFKFLKKQYWEFIKEPPIISYKNQYTSFKTQTEENTNWNGVKLLEELGIDVCPYCGLNYISSVEKKNGKAITIATFDHYLPKSSKYASLALNLYNLIPSCKNCNSTFKGEDERRIINPYFQALEDNITFHINNDTLIEYILDDKIAPQLEILYDPYNVIVYNHCNVLSICDRYNNFKNIIKTLIQKRYRYNKKYLEELENVLDNFSKTQFEKDIIKQDVFSNNEIFSKFKSDIWKQIS